MVIRFESEVQAAFHKAVKSNQELGRLLRFLVNPVALAAYVLAGWRLGADMNWTGEFFISSGLLSHWQVWLALGIGIQVGGSYLNRIQDQQIVS